MKLLKGADYPTDLSELSILLKKAGIKHTLKKHPGVNKQVTSLIGYNPAGDWQIEVKGLSIIRGMVSFGDFEIYDGEDIERTTTAKEMVNIISNIINDASNKKQKTK